jgi:YVTN family beta-propeller protein
MRPALLACTCAFWALAACAGSTDPDFDPDPDPPTGHPLGSNLTFVSVGHGPWGTAVSSRGDLYVTRPFTDSITRVAYADSVPTVIGSFRVGQRPDEIIFSADGRKAYSTNIDDANISVIDAVDGRETRVVDVPGQPLRIAAGTGEATLYITLTNGSLLVVDESSGAVDTTLSIGSTPNGIAIDRTRQRLWVSSTNGTLTEINTASNTKGRVVTLGGSPQEVVLHPTNTSIYIANEAGWITVLDRESLARTDSIPMPGAFRMALTRDATQLWVSQSGLGQVHVVSVATGDPLFAIPTGGAPRHIAFSVGGARAFIANENGRLQMVR